MQIALEERITTHASYINMLNVIGVLNEIDSSNSSTISTRELEMLGRISSTFDFLKETLVKVDPWLVSTNTLEGINSPISQVLNEITNYKSNRNEGHLSNCLSYIEGLLQYLPQLLVTKTPEEIESLRSSIVKFRQSVGQHLSNLENDVTETSTALLKNKEKLTELTFAINDQKSRLDSIVNEFQSQFLQGQTQRTEEFNNLIKKSEEDLKVALQNFEETFDLAIEVNDKNFEEKQKSYDSLIEDLKSKVQTEIEQIHAMNKEAEKILGFMSMKGLAQGYQKIANNEGKKAFVWNALSLFSLIGILWFGYKFIILHEGIMSWTTLVSRIVLTGVGITLFTYCAKQATNHRIEERRNRKIELELASLDPYLKDLEPTKQKEVKQSLVDKYFGVEVTPITPVQQAPIQQQLTADTIMNNPQFIQTVVEKVSQAVTKQ